MSVGLRDGKWRAGGIMLQHLPEDEKNASFGVTNTRDDEWREAMIFLDSCKDDEFLDEDLAAPDLLFRLFHESGVRVFDALPLQNKCRCSIDRVEVIIKGLPADDLEHITEDGKITVRCEFCSHDYVFDSEDIPDTVEES